MDQPAHAGVLVSGGCPVMWTTGSVAVSQLLALRRDGGGNSLQLLPACPLPGLPSPRTFPGGSRDRVTVSLGQ